MERREAVEQRGRVGRVEHGGWTQVLLLVLEGESKGRCGGQCVRF